MKKESSIHHQCLQAALRMLGRRDHSIQELSDKLQIKGYSDPSVADTIEACLRLNYLNDVRFAEMFTQSAKRRGYGPIRIKHQLRSKGVADNLVTMAMNRHFDMEQQTEACRQALKKKLRTTTDCLDQLKTRTKLSQFLYARGFAPDIIHEVMSAHVR